jgi:AraC family transcriptional regulator of adaptative response/methylated-DNA-[protein]-cysteine methyltransferase
MRCGPRHSVRAEIAKDRTMMQMPEGMHFYSVRTTGVYCRPSCSARPKLENVQFHATAADARRAGFRPCKRCKPDREETRMRGTAT